MDDPTATQGALACRGCCDPGPLLLRAAACYLLPGIARSPPRHRLLCFCGPNHTSVLFYGTAVLLPHREDVKLEHAEVSESFLAAFERREGLQCCTVYPLPGGGAAPAELGEGQLISFEEPAYELK